MNDFPGYARARGDVPLGEFDWMVRTQIYASFARSGHAPSLDDLAATSGAGSARVKGSLLKLRDAHQLALSEDGEAVTMAHPFSARSTAYPVETSDFVCHANCAWDALAVPAVLRKDGWTATTCPASGEPLEFGVKRWNVVGDSKTVIHFLTPLRRAWDDIGFT
ncbi:MAG: hypothetical protein HKN72_04085 [Gemmatimonadetes bacterium]|nr:alkylmercury lyase family protein [Gemmatimonadota bacterium]NNF12373.1 hypothetical protein [Gemmatimonadota bacterium]NNL30060.1 hypothetical protein [Gemmatimonadota bacterium]